MRDRTARNITFNIKSREDRCRNPEKTPTDPHDDYGLPEYKTGSERNYEKLIESEEPNLEINGSQQHRALGVDLNVSYRKPITNRPAW